MLGINFFCNLYLNAQESQKRSHAENKTIYKADQLDVTRMQNIAAQFLNVYLNYDTATIKSSVWENNILPYLDIQKTKLDSNNQLYERIYDKDWQLQRVLNPETYCQLQSISFDDSELNKIYITTTENRNGDDEVDSPYFPMIQLIKSNYIIKFTNNYKIYSVQLKNNQIIDTGTNYHNR